MYSKKCCSKINALCKKFKNVWYSSKRNYMSRNVSEKVNEVINQIRQPLTCEKNVAMVAERLQNSITACVSGNKSSLNCINTYVQNFPSGNERGRFLALDLGGTNFRSMLMDINNHGESFSFNKTQVSEEIRSSSGYELFQFMAKFTKSYLVHKLKNIDNFEFPTVLTFSFPVKMTALDKGTIVSFSKGYDCKEVIGKEIGPLLSEAFAKEGVKIKLVGIINDTVGTMLSSRWHDGLTAGGIVLGTGTNACYLEKSSKIKGFKSDKDYVLVNTEWGAFGDIGELDFIRTEFDVALDKESSNPGNHTLEKMVSGMYIGEIARRTLAYLGKRNWLCSKQLSTAIEEPFSFPTQIISKLEEEEITGNCILCRPIKKYYRRKSSIEMLKQELLEREPCKHQNISLNVQDYHVINEVCKAVADRGARLAGIAIACMAQRIDQDRIVFGIDGTVYEKTRAYQNIIPKMLQTLVPEKNVKLRREVDGSIKGAAYLAAALSH